MQSDEECLLSGFGSGSARRNWLAARLRQILSLARSTGKLEKVYLWGSFVTAKADPRDLDLLLLMTDDFTLETTPGDCRALFNHAQAKESFQADIFWSRASIGKEELGLWLDTYQIGRDGRKRGIIELRLL